MTHIQVTAHMAEPIIWYDDGMHLDGILAGAIYNRMVETGEADDLPDPNHVDWPRDFDLPLETWTAPVCGECHARLLDDAGDIWGWCASDVYPDGPSVESSHALRRMIDTGDFVEHTDADRHSRSSGTLKPKDKSYPTLMVPRLQWTARATDLERVAHLLRRHITHLGKLKHHGMGRVREWSVDEENGAWSIADDGETVRHLPTSAVDAETRPTRQGIRPPYWHPSRHVDGAYPSGVEVRG